MTDNQHSKCEFHPNGLTIHNDDNNDDTNIHNKLRIYESKIAYYRKYKKLIDAYNNDSDFKVSFDEYYNSKNFTNRLKYRLSIDNAKLERESEKLEDQITSKSIEYKKLESVYTLKKKELGELELKKKKLNKELDDIQTNLSGFRKMYDADTTRLHQEQKFIEDVKYNLSKEKEEFEEYKRQYLNIDKSTMTSFYSKIVDIVKKECESVRKNENLIRSGRHIDRIIDYKLTEHNTKYYISYEWLRYTNPSGFYIQETKVWDANTVELPKLI